LVTTRRLAPCGLVAASLLFALGTTGLAQQTTGTPGSPSATTTIDGRYLPNSPQLFRGDISPNAGQSKPFWPARVVPPKGAPNILLIMTDDVGFSAPSTFGGVIPTPTLDRIAQMGLRYTAFHTTALCSPTRAALLTGRNHHSVATGVVVDQATGYPGYNSVIPRAAVAIGEILRQNGYDTSWYGKDHNVPQWEGSQAGPFHNWPTGPIKGFDYYYGFVGDDTSQWQPNNLFRNTTPIEPYLGKPGWNLITAMADEAIGRIKMLNEVQPDRPFMIYYAPGGTHSPHHPTKEWVDKISQMHLFDDGWNKLRDTIFANQKRLGVIAPNAQLTAWPKDLPQWDTLSSEAKKLYIRQAEVYGVPRLHGPRDRSRHPSGRRHRQARQHANHLRQWRQRCEPRGHAPRPVQRVRHDEWPPPDGGREHEVLRRLGHRPNLSALRGGLGMGLGYALSVDQRSCLTLRRHTQRHGHGLAGAHQGRRRHPPTVPPRD
jgi:arylsulfatase